MSTASNEEKKKRKRISVLSIWYNLGCLNEAGRLLYFLVQPVPYPGVVLLLPANVGLGLLDGLLVGPAHRRHTRLVLLVEHAEHLQLEA